MKQKEFFQQFLITAWVRCLFFTLFTFFSCIATLGKVVYADQLNRPDAQHQFFQSQFISKVRQKKQKIVLVASGWSQSGLEKIYRMKNLQKQKRAFAPAYNLALQAHVEGRAFKLYFLTATNIHVSYRQYLYALATGDSQLVGFRDFERAKVKIIRFRTIKRQDQRAAQDRLAYFDLPANQRKLLRLKKELNELKDDPHALILGMTVHATGHFLLDQANFLGISLLANHPDLNFWKRKSQSRVVYRDLGILHPEGTYRPVYSNSDLAVDIVDILAKTGRHKVIVKLDFSAAGDGNTLFDFSAELEDPQFLQNREQAAAIIADRFNFSDNYQRRLGDFGAIVEEFIEGQDFTSPATLYMVSDTQNVDVYYQYDQVLGGHDHQVFQGSAGPLAVNINPGAAIVKFSQKIGTYLAQEGVRGHVGTDFIVVKQNEASIPSIYAIENNIRATGTMYAIWSAAFLSNWETINNRFVSSFDDWPVVHYRSMKQRRILQNQFFTWMRQRSYSFNPKTGRGVLIHLPTFGLGKIGAVIVGYNRNDTEELTELFSKDLEDFNINIEGVL